MSLINHAMINYALRLAEVYQRRQAVLVSQEAVDACLELAGQCWISSRLRLGRAEQLLELLQNLRHGE